MHGERSTPKREPILTGERLFFGGIVSALAALLFWLLCLNHVSVQEVGISYNSWTGEISVQREPGWHVTSPATSVAVVGLLPTQVCIFAGSRITTCKLVRFSATDEGVAAFVREQGFHYYGSTNQGSNCNSATAVCGGVPAILKGYAFSGDVQPFLEVVKEENALSK